MHADMLGHLLKSKPVGSSRSIASTCKEYPAALAMHSSLAPVRTSSECQYYRDIARKKQSEYQYTY